MQLEGRGMSSKCSEDSRRCEGFTVHPAETFAGNHLEVDALVAVLCVDHVRELDGVELESRISLRVVTFGRK